MDDPVGAADRARSPAVVGPTVLVFSSLFPSRAQPLAGVFIKERMFRVGRHVPIIVCAPQPWFPLQLLLRLVRPGYRPTAPVFETVDGVAVHRPRFLSFPGIFKRFDGALMAWSCRRLLRRLVRQHDVALIDAHFAYPDGYAASLLAHWLRLPFTVTLRGTEARHVRDRHIAPRLRLAVRRAARVIAVADALRRIALDAGVPEDRSQVIGNGVDLWRFAPRARGAARSRLDLLQAAPVLVSVGGLVERKGFHRVIALLPALLQRHPDLVYLVVGGPCPEGDIGAALRAQVAQLGLERQVRFLGPVAPDDLSYVLSAADLFVLSTRNEGWANVFLEAMACGLPVVTTDVGGNREVVCSETLGTVVAFGDELAMVAAIDAALRRAWDRDAIRAHALANGWDARVAQVLAQFARTDPRLESAHISAVSAAAAAVAPTACRGS